MKKIFKIGSFDTVSTVQDFVDNTDFDLEDLSTTALDEDLSEDKFVLDDSVREKGWKDYPGLVDYTAYAAGIDLSKVKNGN